MTTLGKYELHEQLGKGGFGIVYRATDMSLGRDVALKVLHPQLMVDENFVERFKKEAQVLSVLEHPNIVTIYELNDIDGRLFIAMRYLSGGSLQMKIQEGPLACKKILTIMHQLCTGLQAAHEDGLIHRDIKPANILFDNREEVIISDFGLARAVQVSGASSSLGIVGTPAYRAPELWRGKPPASPATDVYSLGCVLFEMITGKILFDGNTPDEIITQHLVDGPQFPETWPEGTPSGLIQVLKKALEKDPAKRQTDAGQLLDEIKCAYQSIHAVEEKKYESIHNNKTASIIKGIDHREKIIRNFSGNEMSVEIAPGVTMDFVCVPAGEFIMGSDPQIDHLADKDEQPQHRVYLDEYWIGKYPVTNQQYQAFVSSKKDENKSGWHYQEGKEDHPAVNISWEDASIFCKWMCAQTGLKIRLPSEAKWEKAARGTDGRIFPWGNKKPDNNLANYGGNVGDTTAVGSYPAGASPYGALDMAGNVWEWTADWYAKEYYSPSLARNPVGPQTGRYCVLRGGSWNSSDLNTRSASRDGLDPSDWLSYIGFRCAFSA